MKRSKGTPPPQGHWEGDTYIFAPTAAELFRAQQEVKRERDHKRWQKRQKLDANKGA